MRSLVISLMLLVLTIFSGCESASKENPTITLSGPTDITIKPYQQLREPGFKASDDKDGDLTNAVKVTTNLDTAKEGVYYINYTVVDSDGNKGYASRTVTVAKNSSNDDFYSGEYLIDDGKVYDITNYLFNPQVYSYGKTIEEKYLLFDNLSQEPVATKTFTYERNENDESIYEFIDNHINNRAEIGIDSIKYIHNTNSNLIKRRYRVGDSFSTKDSKGRFISCELMEHLAPIDNPAERFYIHSVIADVSSQYDFDYADVLKFGCDNGSYIYYANGWGTVLNVDTKGNYQLLNKNSYRIVK